MKPYTFFFVSLFLLFGIRLDSFSSFFSAFVLLAVGSEDDGESLSSGALTERERERERERIICAHTYTRENKAIFLLVFLSENDDFSDDSDDGDVLFFFASSSSSSATRTRCWEDDDQRTGGVLQEQH